MNRNAYNQLFTTPDAAIEHEQSVLSIGDEFLPEEARQVRDGQVTEPSSDYWDFLASQIELEDEPCS